MPVRPSEKEEAYFARVEFERRKRIEEEKQRLLQEAERQRLREMHFMRCPKCGMDLIAIDYKGITLDKCSSCGGLWFDAQEFETILAAEQSALNKIFSIFSR